LKYLRSGTENEDMKNFCTGKEQSLFLGYDITYELILLW